MTYAIYYIHPQSLSVNIRDFYNKYETAVKRLKLDVEEYIKANKNVDKVDFVNKKKDINLKEDGYYLKISNKYPNRITIYEKTSKLLAKVKVSGGGRCNVTHACFNNTELSKFYPRGGRFMKKTFGQFSTSDTVNWFESKGVKLKTETDNRMFPITDVVCPPPEAE